MGKLQRLALRLSARRPTVHELVHLATRAEEGDPRAAARLKGLRFPPAAIAALHRVASGMPDCPWPEDR